MVHSCCAYGCTERASKESPITFHSFPKDEVRRKIWEIKIRRKNFKATKSSKLCSKHFTPDCFDRLKFGGTWLKETAVPTIFNFPKYFFENKKCAQTIGRPAPIIVRVSGNVKYFEDFNEEEMNFSTEAKKLLSVAKAKHKKSKYKRKKCPKKQQEEQQRASLDWEGKKSL